MTGSKPPRNTKAVVKIDGESSQDRVKDNGGVPGCAVSRFDFSIENHFTGMDTISKLCGGGAVDGDAFGEGEIHRLSSSITFLREWRHFSYKPRAVRFASEIGIVQEEGTPNVIYLPHFSSAAVPQHEEIPAGMTSLGSRKDFLLYVGGLIWAQDWCPRPYPPDSHAYCEFIAVSAHPPDSSYHKLGVPISGRGMVQIWCLLSSRKNKGIVSGLIRHPKQKPGVNGIKNEEEAKLKRPRKTPIETKQNRSRGSPMKHPVNVVVGDCENHSQPLAVQQPDCSLNALPTDESFVLPPAPVKGVHANDGQPITCSSKSKLKINSSIHNGSDNEIVQSAIDGSAELNVYQRRSRKHPVNVVIDSFENHAQPLPIQLPDCSVNSLRTDEWFVHPPDPAGGVHVNDGEPITCPSKSKLKFNPSIHSGSNSETVQSALGGSAELRIYRRSRRRPVDVVIGGCKNHVQPLAVQLPDCSVNALPTDDLFVHPPGPVEGVHVNDGQPITCSSKSKLKNNSSIHNGRDSEIVQSALGGGAEPALACRNDTTSDGNGAADDSSLSCSTPYANAMDAILPRVVLCIGHDGKVAWDVKWRPCASESHSKSRMGYLAVVLGNGSTEVWEIPSPGMLRAVFSSQHKEHIDPRFVKLKPVFRCSMLKYGERHSIPLIVEWSGSAPHDLLLAGCHDGLVALWKFCPSGSSEETRPLLCFSADTVPIRTLAWAPSGGDSESSNIIVTAGHEGLKFWDLRNPFRPLWDINPVPRLIYSLDWLPDPRCVVTSYDDGTLRILSLGKAAYDVPATGKPFAGSPQQGLHSLYCSPFAIWSVHVSRLTGMVAYCGADGNVLYFQLTMKAVEKDPHRHSAPHFLCGSITDEGSAVIVNTAPSDTPHPMKKSEDEWANAPRSKRGYTYTSNQLKRQKNEVSLQKPEGQVLALCYGDEPGQQDEPNFTQSLKKCRTSSKKKGPESEACTDPEGSASKPGGKWETADVIETLPSKIVAMHRVRWNMNKGSEQWLCYGGAAGILRCQEIFAPNVSGKNN